jgi:prepilin-type N-terminal cleavage/methylation domain-containing protein
MYEHRNKLQREFERGFTLIELLVVISVIALLMGILIPVLNRAKGQARKVACQSNMRQIATTISTYESDNLYDFRANERWYFKNGTADHAHEWQPRFTQDIMNSGLLPDRKIFFCPSVSNLSYKRNYIYNGLVRGDRNYYDTEYIEKNISNDFPVFWSTHHWIWKKRVTSETPNVNGISSGALMCDMSPSAWYRTGVVNNLGFNFIEELGIKQTVEHYNVLMKDMSVQNPSDRDIEINQWLWGTDNWPGTALPNE